MDCDSCHKNQAVMRYTEVKDGSSESFNLCLDCARSKGVADPVGSALLSLGQLLDGMLSGILTPDSCDQRISCLRCGLKLSDFRQAGRLGCGSCYQAFAPVLRPMLKQIHGQARHLGKWPITGDRALPSTPQDRLPHLRRELSLAVAREDFETAASLRDQIKLVEAETDNGPLRSGDQGAD